ncbi:hypothetical protein D3C86_1906240 [compost metagenome]
MRVLLGVLERHEGVAGVPDDHDPVEAELLPDALNVVDQQVQLERGRVGRAGARSESAVVHEHQPQALA